MKNKFREIIHTYFSDKYPFTFRLSEAKEAQLWKVYKTGGDILIKLDSTLDYLRKRTNYPFYWYDLGFSIDESLKYSLEKGWLVCPWCGSAYHITLRYKSCCSEECFSHNFDRRIARYKASVSGYNCRDPIQYAERHDISIEEATKIVNDFVHGGSWLRLEYWLKRGYSEEDARIEISKKQKTNSCLTVTHYLHKGFTEEEAKDKISILQKNNCIKKFEKYSSEELKHFSHRCWEYWVDKGYSEEESKDIISNRNKEYGLIGLEKYTYDERKKFSIRNIEYWKEKFPDTYVEEFEKWYAANPHPSTTRSVVADNFFTRLSDKFEGNKIYCKDTEFGKFIPDFGYVRYDYVDLTLKVCVEFNGDYWHGNPRKYSSGEYINFPKGQMMLVDDLWEDDRIKVEYMKSLGFVVYVVWEMDYNKNPNLVEDLYRNIINESS